MGVAEVAILHRRFVLTPWSAQAALSPPVIERADNVYLYDLDGRRYLDLSSGLIAANLGHGHPKVVAAMQQQAAKLCFAPPSFFMRARAELAREIIDLTGWADGGRVFFTTGGGEANEDAVKISRMATGRFKILTAYRSFHGSAPGAGSLSGESRRWPVEPGMPGVVRFVTPYPYRSPFDAATPEEETRRALNHLEFVLLGEDPHRVAAVMLEPVVGSNGVIIYPPGYLKGVRELCDRYGIILIFDEVMTGFGRVGAPFAAIRFDVSPDIITFAKGVASAYVPLGGCAVRESIACHFDHNVLWCGHTYAGHPLTMAVGLAAVRAYREEKIFERVAEVEQWLSAGLDSLKRKHALIGDVRGIGAFFCLELVKDRASREPLVPWQGAGPGVMNEFFVALRRAGAHAFGRYNIVHIAPPLVIKSEQVQEGIEALDKALTALSMAL